MNRLRSKNFLCIAVVLLLFQAFPGLAAESSFLCKKIDEPVTLIFSATSVISKDTEGNYSEPTDVSFGYSPDGKHRVWTTSDRAARFVLMKGQIFIMTTTGQVLGKIICE
jgi:hypothetical protein